MTIVIREVSGADLNRINVLQSIILPSDRPYSTSVGWWWLATDTETGVDVGFCGMVQSAQWIDAVYLCRAGVRACARGKGLQKRLIRVRERKARSLGFRYAVTDTYRNPASANSLIACGFRSYIPRNAWAHENCNYWRKTLAKVSQQ